MRADDFVKMLTDFGKYMREPLNFTDEDDEIYGNVSYPVAYLGDVKIYFMHYSTEEEAQEAWNRRKARINWDNIYVMFTDKSGCTDEDLINFDRVPFKHKVVFTHTYRPDIKSSFYIRGYEKDGEVGILTEFTNSRFPVKRYIDQFDYVKWFNDGKEFG